MNTPTRLTRAMLYIAEIHSNTGRPPPPEVVTIIGQANGLSQEHIDALIVASQRADRVAAFGRACEDRDEDFLNELIRERTAKNPEFPRLVEEALARHRAREK